MSARLEQGSFVVAIASFFRDRGELSTNISIWFFVIAYGAALRNHASGLFVATVILCIGPALHRADKRVWGNKTSCMGISRRRCCVGVSDWMGPNITSKSSHAGWMEGA